MKVTQTGPDEWTIVATTTEARKLREGLQVGVTLADDRARGANPTWAQDLELRAEGMHAALEALHRVPAFDTVKRKGSKR